MKLWQIFLLAFAVGGIGFCGWWLYSGSEGTTAASEANVLRSRRVIRENKSAKKSKARLSNARRNRADVAIKNTVDNDWDPFAEDKSGFNMDFDLGLDEGAIVEMSTAVRSILDRISRAQAKFDKKGVLTSVRQLLAMMARGETVSAQAKVQAIGALQFVGGGIADTLPELVQFAADENPEVARVSLEALQEMLWDFDTTPQQIADAIGQLVKLTNDPNIINPFVFEMTDMPAQLKVATSLTILDSRNDAAIAVLDDNKAFVFDDFDGKVQTRQDIIQYGRDHKDE